MKEDVNRKNISIGTAIVFGLVLLVVGWLGGIMYAQRSIKARLEEVQREGIIASMRQIDSLNRQLTLDKELIVRLASQIDTLQKTKLLAVAAPATSRSNNSSIKNAFSQSNGKKLSGNAVFVLSDEELDFFNSYVENETDMDF
jgi:hypothetical protein